MFSKSVNQSVSQLFITFPYRFLERQLGQLWDPYEVAITTYALTTVASTEKEVALKTLEAMARKSTGKNN